MKRDLLSVKKTAISFFCLFSFLFLVSCESLSFYSQAIRGQLSILSKRENIQALIADPATDAALKQRLSSILEIREFAETELALSRAGKDVGTPILTFRPGSNREGSFFGPVISKAPKGEDASELWDAIEKLATSGVAELKRSNRAAPDYT